MNKKKIELQVLNISNSQAQAGAYAMVLGEINGMRQLPVIIGSAEAQSMMIEMRGIVPPRPLTHTLFASVLKVLGATLLRVLIYKVHNGIFYRGSGSLGGRDCLGNVFLIICHLQTSFSWHEKSQSADWPATGNLLSERCTLPPVVLLNGIIIVENTRI